MGGASDQTAPERNGGKGETTLADFLTIAMAQTTPDASIEDVIAKAAEMGAAIVLFPEMFSNGYNRFDPDDAQSRQAWLAAAEPLEGFYVGRFRQAARDNAIAVVATFLEQGEDKPFNSAVLIDSQGDIILHQRKRHICFFDVPEEACAKGESSKTARLMTSAGNVVIGILICMDREFPDAASDLAGDGAEIVLVPNSCRLVDDPIVGDVRVAGMRALAFQSTIAVAVANYPEPKDDGHSFAVDAIGRIVAMGGNSPELVMAKFDIDEIRSIQKQEWFRRAR